MSGTLGGSVMSEFENCRVCGQKRPADAPSGAAVTLVLLMEGYGGQFEATIALQ